MDFRKTEVRHMAGHGASAEDAARFLHELRQLRHGAGLGQAELAARAHYPDDRIRDAEAGPAVPDLPVLSAYVRGCGGTTEEWEERWRSLTRSPALPVLASRHAGRSAAHAGSSGRTGPAAAPLPETPRWGAASWAEPPAPPITGANKVTAGFTDVSPDRPSSATSVTAASVTAASREPMTVASEAVTGAREPVTVAREPMTVPSEAVAGVRGASPRAAAVSDDGGASSRAAAVAYAASRAAIVLLAAVLVCVLAVVLSIFI